MIFLPGKPFLWQKIGFLSQANCFGQRVLLRWIKRMNLHASLEVGNGVVVFGQVDGEIGAEAGKRAVAGREKELMLAEPCDAIFEFLRRHIARRCVTDDEQFTVPREFVRVFGKLFAGRGSHEVEAE